MRRNPAYDDHSGPMEESGFQYTGEDDGRLRRRIEPENGLQLAQILGFQTAHMHPIDEPHMVEAHAPLGENAPKPRILPEQESYAVVPRITTDDIHQRLHILLPAFQTLDEGLVIIQQDSRYMPIRVPGTRMLQKLKQLIVREPMPGPACVYQLMHGAHPVRMNQEEAGPVPHPATGG